jgi:hypothetical protein
MHIVVQTHVAATAAARGGERIYVRRRRVCKKHTADNNNIHVAGSAAAIWMAASLSSLHMHTRPFILISGMCVLVMIIMERR